MIRLGKKKYKISYVNRRLWTDDMWRVKIHRYSNINQITLQVGPIFLHCWEG